MKDLFEYFKTLLEQEGMTVRNGFPKFTEQQKNTPLYVLNFENHIPEKDMCNRIRNNIDVVISIISEQNSADIDSYTNNLERLDFIENLIRSNINTPVSYDDTRISFVSRITYREAGVDNALRFVKELVVSLQWQ